MQKHPTYIGIFATDPKGSAKDLRNYAKQCIEEVLGRVNSLFVQQDYNGFDQNFTLPKDNHHITTLYIGNNPKSLSQKQSHHLNSFKPDQKIPIKIALCIYVPGCIVVGFCSETGGIECDNKFPHVTLLLAGETKAVESNAVCEEVFKEAPGLADEDFVVKEMKEKYKGKSVFVIKRAIEVAGITGDNFKYGSRK